MYKFIICIILLAPLAVLGKIIDADSLNTINKDYHELLNDYAAKDILVILGRKEVIFKPFFSANNQLNKNAKIQEVMKSMNHSKVVYFDTILLTEYKNELLDHNLPLFIKNIINKGSPVIISDNGLTGGFNNIKKLEIWKADYLRKFDIDLSSSFPDHSYLIFNNMESFDNTYPAFYQGILSSNNLPIFRSILNFLIEVKFIPKILIMISNDGSDLIGTETQLKYYDDQIMFIGYKLANKQESYNPDFIKSLKELVNKANAVKRNNAKITTKNKRGSNPYDQKK